MRVDGVGGGCQGAGAPLAAIVFGPRFAAEECHKQLVFTAAGVRVQFGRVQDAGDDGAGEVMRAQRGANVVLDFLELQALPMKLGLHVLSRYKVKITLQVIAREIARLECYPPRLSRKALIEVTAASIRGHQHRRGQRYSATIVSSSLL